MLAKQTSVEVLRMLHHTYIGQNGFSHRLYERVTLQRIAVFIFRHFRGLSFHRKAQRVGVRVRACLDARQQIFARKYDKLFALAASNKTLCRGGGKTNFKAAAVEKHDDVG